MKCLMVIAKLIEEYQLIRRLMLFWMAGMTTYALHWTLSFAAGSPRPGMEVAAILGAVWGPMTALQGFVFAAYNSARKDA